MIKRANDISDLTYSARGGGGGGKVICACILTSLLFYFQVSYQSKVQELQKDRIGGKEKRWCSSTSNEKQNRFALERQVSMFYIGKQS